VPVRDAKQAIAGALYAGKLLNRNYDLVDSLRNAAFGGEMYRGKHVGTVTIFQWDLRIATNVVTRQGERAIGTRVSTTVYDRVLENGLPWFDRAFVVNDWYLSAYEPIRDIGGRIVGIFYMGMLEAKYDAMRRAAIGKLITVTAVGMLVALILTYVLAGKLAAPLGELNAAARKLAQGVLGHTVDLRPTYREAQDLTNAFNEMSKQLRTREEQLIQTNEELKVANRSYFEMLGFITHELKSPLSSCVLNVNILKDGISWPLNDQQKKVVDAIRRNLSYFDEMIKNYLDLSRIENQELTVKPAAVALLQECIQPVIDGLKSQLDERQMTAEVDVPDTLTVEADPNLMRVVYENLLSNATKYGRPQSTIRVQCEERDSRVRLSVWNEGQGIPPDQISLLFQKFSRLQQKGTEREKGSGLGLFICREIIEKHGGRIWAESEPGKWANFIFELPKKGEQAASV